MKIGQSRLVQNSPKNDGKSIMTDSELLEVGRTAHELSLRHGRGAYQYATKLAAQALA